LPKLRGQFLLHVFEQPELHGMEDLHAWGAGRHERELGCQPNLRELRARSLYQRHKLPSLFSVDQLLRRRVHLCKRYEQNGRGVPKLRSGPFLYVFEQPSVYGMEDLLARGAYQNEWYFYL
jgi:hypothetical protein